MMSSWPCTGHFVVPWPWGRCKILNIRIVCQQGLTTELTANSSRITEINTLADQLVNTDHRHSDAVKKRRKEINDMWDFMSYIGTRFEYYEGLTLVNYQLSNNKLFYCKPSHNYRQKLYFPTVNIWKWGMDYFTLRGCAGNLVQVRIFFSIFYPFLHWEFFGLHKCLWFSQCNMLLLHERALIFFGSDCVH